MELWDPTEKRVISPLYSNDRRGPSCSCLPKKGAKALSFFKSKPASICCIDVQHFDGLHQDSLRNLDFTVLIDGSCTRRKQKARPWASTSFFPNVSAMNKWKYNGTRSTKMYMPEIYDGLEKATPFKYGPIFAKCNFAKGWFRTVLG